MAEIHPTSIIDPAAEIGSGCHIGPYCVIGAGVSLGDHCHLLNRVTLVGPTRTGSTTHSSLTARSDTDRRT